MTYNLQRFFTQNNDHVWSLCIFVFVCLPQRSSYLICYNLSTLKMEICPTYLQFWARLGQDKPFGFHSPAWGWSWYLIKPAVLAGRALSLNEAESTLISHVSPFHTLDCFISCDETAPDPFPQNTIMECID